MLTYWHIDTFEVVGFSDSDYACCLDDNKFTYGYIFMMGKRVVSLLNFIAGTYSFFYYGGKVCGML